MLPETERRCSRSSHNRDQLNNFTLNNRHYGVQCTMCRKSAFSGIRYKCLRCRDHNLCETCYNVFININDGPKHYFQSILSAQDFQLYYANEHLDPQMKCYSYTCPYCGQLGFDVDTLLNHLIDDHSELQPNKLPIDTTQPPPCNSGNPGKVLCPICCARMFHNHVFVTNLKTHIIEEHKDLGVNLWRNVNLSDSQSSVMEYNTTSAAGNNDIGEIFQTWLRT